MCLGIPGKIVAIREDTPIATGTVDFGGVRRDVCLAYVEDSVRIGDYVVVHVGFAISKIDEAEAQKTYKILQEMSELGDLELMSNGADLVDAASLPSAQPLSARSLL